MLKKDIKKVVAVLKLLYSNINWFSVKGDTVRMKRRAYSLHSWSMPLQFLLNNIIPDVMSARDAEYAEAYRRELNEALMDKEVTKQYQIVFNYFTTFVHKYEFKGILYDSGNSKQLFKAKLPRWVSFLLDKVPKFNKGALDVKVIKKLPEKFKSMEEILKTEFSEGYRVMGKVVTGDSKFDSQFLQVIRYSSSALVI